MIIELNESIALDRHNRNDYGKNDDNGPPREGETSEEESMPSNSSDSVERVNHGKLLFYSRLPERIA